MAKDLRQRKSEVFGPFAIYLDSGERDELNNLLTEEHEDPISGEMTRVNKKEKEPTLEKVFFKKNHYTLKAELENKGRIDKAKEESMMLHTATESMLEIVHSWDLMLDGNPVPLTMEGIKEAEVDSEIIYAILGKYGEATRPPKALNSK